MQTPEFTQFPILTWNLIHYIYARIVTRGIVRSECVETFIGRTSIRQIHFLPKRRSAPFLTRSWVNARNNSNKTNDS